MEQQLTVKYLKLGFKLIKKNYFTYEPKIIDKKEFISPLTKQTYSIDKHIEVIVKTGEGMKKSLVLG